RRARGGYLFLFDNGRCKRRSNYPELSAREKKKRRILLPPSVASERNHRSVRFDYLLGRCGRGLYGFGRPTRAPRIFRMSAQAQMRAMLDQLMGTSRDGSMYLCLPTSFCKGVSERPRIRRAVSYC
uniref:Uncharacterized protein n=1 Tax=Laticauda laticaudata TaxID=8630 RepID=A0A8C5S264_LATLA